MVAVLFHIIEIIRFAKDVTSTCELPFLQERYSSGHDKLNCEEVEIDIIESIRERLTRKVKSRIE